MFHYSYGLLLPCFAIFYCFATHVRHAFGLRSSCVLLLVILLLLCDVIFMFHNSHASSLLCALVTFLLFVASLCPCVSPLLCFIIPFPVSILPPFVFLSFQNLAQGVWGVKASTNIFSNLELGAKDWCIEALMLELWRKLRNNKLQAS
jgi:hypothetical protein